MQRGGIQKVSSVCRRYAQRTESKPKMWKAGIQSQNLETMLKCGKSYIESQFV